MASKHQWPSDGRTADRRSFDGKAVKTQIDRIQDTESARSYQRELFDKIRRRRAPGSYELGTLERRDDFLVAVVGEVLVRKDQRAKARDILARRGFSGGLDVPALGNRVTRFRNLGASVQDAVAAARELRENGINASVNYVVPLGYVAKGEGGFEPTQSSLQGPGSGQGTGVQVAIVDTGISPEIRGDGWLVNLWRSGLNTDPLYVGSTPPNRLDFSAGHGTFAAGIIQRLAPDANIRMYRAIGSDGIGSEVDIAQAILRAADDGAKLINLSLGTETDGQDPPVGLAQTLQLLADKHDDVLVVAAAGNSGRDAKTYPAACDGVVGVASLTSDLQPSTWSNHGDWVECSTIGEGVVSTYVIGEESPDVDKDGPDSFFDNAWAIGTGTSFATPQIVGAIANLMSTNNIDARTAKQQLLAPANEPKPTDGYGYRVGILPGTPPTP